MAKKGEFGKKMTKTPLTSEEQERILKIAKEEGTYFGVDIEKTILVLLDTGMHISVLANPKKHNVNFGLTENGRPEIRWARPKKKGIAADTNLILSPRIRDWIQEFMFSKRPDYTLFYYRMIQEIGNKAGFSKLSPMTFRHTFGVNLSRLGIPESEIKDLMNCSEKTLKGYLKYTSGMKEDMLVKKMGWD